MMAATLSLSYCNQSSRAPLSCFVSWIRLKLAGVFLLILVTASGASVTTSTYPVKRFLRRLLPTFAAILPRTWGRATAQSTGRSEVRR
ncbi:uncharacterized protein EDB91DRAFT_359276 [Suillus paluster]|uniref:uncharacterized protein n=1 Tax=Suillus paluster TaxID=48578 RepID=UPI001B871A1A|nr:uncharacterized protein EDB91DRAFT_359276 [Suillus paluster]KAG1740146.1 hypothetical protein EDB91DRAFT_359276 [Suillus paluster]